MAHTLASLLGLLVALPQVAPRNVSAPPAAGPHDPPGLSCGGRMNGTNGYIQTPNFPAQFPVPLSCTWVLYAPPGQKVVVYFTQFYVRQGFHVAEYEHYQDDQFYVSKTDLGPVSYEDEVTTLVAYKPYLVLRFQVGPIMGNMHLRVEHFLLDVYGFNLTYEIVGENEDLRPDACSVYDCSFLGNCLVSSDFALYRCHCFDGFFGKHCQFGPYCDPAIGMNMCRNGGTCR